MTIESVCPRGCATFFSAEHYRNDGNPPGRAAVKHRRGRLHAGSLSSSTEGARGVSRTAPSFKNFVSGFGTAIGTPKPHRIDASLALHHGLWNTLSCGSIALSTTVMPRSFNDCAKASYGRVPSCTRHREGAAMSGHTQVDAPILGSGTASST